MPARHGRRRDCGRDRRALGARLAAAGISLLAVAATPAFAATGRISTAAGTGAGGFSGDGGAATSAQIDGPRGVAWLPDGGFVFADLVNSRVRRVLPDGTITTIAGTGTNGYNGDDQAGTAAQLDFVHGVATMPDGDVVIADTRNRMVRHVSLATGMITRVAGTGEEGYAGDGGPATEAKLSDIRGLAVTGYGSILIADSGNAVVRQVNPDGIISTVAGTPRQPGFAGDGGPATSAMLNLPFGVWPRADGGFLIADHGNNRIRRVLSDGRIDTVAGSGAEPSSPTGENGDGGPALQAKMYGPHSVVETPPGGFLPAGGFLIADNLGNRVRFVAPDGIISTLAGTGVAGSSGDGGAPERAELNGPRGLAIRSDGALLIAEFGPPNFTDPPVPPGGDRVRLVRMLPPPELEVRLAGRLRVRFGRPLRVTFRCSRRATVRVTVTKGRRTVARREKERPRGRDRITIRRRLAVGRYRLLLRARTTDGRTARARARLRIVRGGAGRAALRGGEAVHPAP